MLLIEERMAINWIAVSKGSEGGGGGSSGRSSRRSSGNWSVARCDWDYDQLWRFIISPKMGLRRRWRHPGRYAITEGAALSGASSFLAVDGHGLSFIKEWNRPTALLLFLSLFYFTPRSTSRFGALSRHSQGCSTTASIPIIILICCWFTYSLSLSLSLSFSLNGIICFKKLISIISSQSR